MTEPVKRRYQSDKRAAAAALTRARIRDAAARLFTEQGYAATTLRQVAATAGVGERTLYDAFPGKAALFAHTLGVAVVGDEQPVPVADRPEVRATQDEPDPRAAIARTVDYTAELLERAGDLIMVSVEAAGADPDMRATADAGAAATHAVHLELTRGLHARGALRPDLDAVAAADILFALASPHVFQLLRRLRGWSPERYRAWLRDTLVRELLA
ncbi:TetR/AcrR family transcriptional regulator [Yinghuangia seranimata]|uniref:TetR/AcrR family transcriptional regulator n=1 Tax=Yinghuangia seranimata TaxID=408067 RepID=UPI00248C8094|nr:TetR/AcrR family transcriptional regulator [Yinghuangia seranimata]MDI2131433.1 helix-turn-helix domain-containing protein [Yinghuangia seranimata]